MLVFALIQEQKHRKRIVFRAEETTFFSQREFFNYSFYKGNGLYVILTLKIHMQN